MSTMFFLAQNYHFAYNSGMERRELLDFFNEDISKYKAAREFEELEKSGHIKRTKDRPITYVLNESFIRKL